MSDAKYNILDTPDQAKFTTFNFTVPSLFSVWTLLILIIIAIVVNYLITFRIWIFEKIRPSENFTNCDYYNENDYYK
jgi:hypothetical protein